jgi:Histidine kinase-, DNA gyrase B-, and HSP90-like ATPase
VAFFTAASFCTSLAMSLLIVTMPASGPLLMASVKSCSMVEHLPIAVCSAWGRSAGFPCAGLASIPRLLSAEPAGARKPYCCAAAVPWCLLMNVLVHTPVGTTGTVTAAAAGDHVTVEVSDDGPGVPPDKLPHIFERFYRAASQGTRGSGLGLAIAAEIAAAHGGTAQAAPAVPRGVRVLLTLPAGPPPGPGQRAGQELLAIAAS